MSGRHREVAMSRRPGPRWLAGLLGLALAGVVLLLMTPANAAQRNVKAQLSFSGVATKDNPAGGTQVAVHPGDSVTFSAAGVPTAGLAKLGLDNLVSNVDSLLSGGASLQVKADFSNLPGGKKGTVLSGKKSVSFHFPSKATYNFTWTFEKVTPQLLGGNKVTPINLNGNELKQAGIKLNAANEYVGKVVVTKKPSQGGISVQLPSVHVAPSVTGVGQLPTVGAPGVTPPTLHASLPNLPSLPVSVPNLPSLPNLPGQHQQKHHQHGSHSNQHTGYKGPQLTVPDQVVPNGNNAAVLPGSGNYAGGGSSQGGNALDVPPIPGSSNGGGGAPANNSANHPELAKPQSKTMDLASDPANPSSQLPVILAIVSIVVLALVAGTYARLLLQRRNL